MDIINFKIDSLYALYDTIKSNNEYAGSLSYYQIIFKKLYC